MHSKRNHANWALDCAPSPAVAVIEATVSRSEIISEVSYFLSFDECMGKDTLEAFCQKFYCKVLVFFWGRPLVWTTRNFTFSLPKQPPKKTKQQKNFNLPWLRQAVPFYDDPVWKPSWNRGRSNRALPFQFRSKASKVPMDCRECRKCIWDLVRDVRGSYFYSFYSFFWVQFSIIFIGYRLFGRPVFF